MTAAEFCDRGKAWAEKGEYDKAIADFTEAIRLDPKIALAFYNRGSAWHLTRRSTTRRSPTSTEAIRLDPKYAHRLLQPRACVGREEGVRQGDHGLRRGHPARPQVRERLHQPRARLALQEGVRQGDRGLRRGHPTRPHSTQWPSTTAGTRGAKRASTTRRSRTTTEAIRLDPKDATRSQQPRGRLAGKGELRQGDRGLHRGHPARPQIRDRLR